MKKRLISLALTLALCLGLAIPVMAAGSYGPYTITGASYGRAFTVTFSAAKTERRTIQIREHGDIGNTYSAYQKKTVTYVTIRPDTKVTALSGDEPMVSVAGVSADGDGRYTQIVMGAPETIENGTGWDAFITEFPLVYLYSDTGEYLITMDSTATPSGFTDVKAGAYYADAVKWAVDRKITSGTSDTNFSPDQTCTVAQILTFLWNANGQPEPTGRNPFSDISSGDYFYKAAVWAAGKGLVSGSKLNPNAPCTRAMVVEYLWKLAGSPAVSSSNKQYAALNIRDIDSSEREITLSFEAAIQKQAPVKICRDTWDDVGEPVYHTGVTEQEYQLIIVRPGSKITVSGGSSEGQLGSNEILAEPLPVDSDGVFHPQPSESPSFMSTGNLSEEAYLIEGSKQTYLVVTNDSIHEKVLGNMVDAAGFTDVPSGAAYAQAVAWAVEKGVTAGTSDTTFSPDNTCTRGQIVTFLHRAMG